MCKTTARGQSEIGREKTLFRRMFSIDNLIASVGRTGTRTEIGSPNRLCFAKIMQIRRGNLMNQRSRFG